MLLTAFALLLSGGFPDRIAAQIPDSAPRLVVLIVVDQFRADLLFRYRVEWTGGFKHILDQGVVFPAGEQDHAITQTAPGHSTLLSGRFPAHTGIVTNNIGVVDPLSPLIGDSTTTGASPHRFRGTALADWMLANDSTTRVLSVAMKNRAAILPIGRSREQVYWWSPLGFYTTSRYYRDSLPDWLTGWNARKPLQSFLGKQWTLLASVSTYLEPDSLAAEKGVDGRMAFPHQLSNDPRTAGDQIVHFPWMDSLSLDLALTGVSALRIGSGESGRTDLLSVSLASVDEIGHDFGPDSREMHDELLHLDRYLGWFLDSLATMVPPERTVFVLSADHGTQAMPEQGTPAPGFSPGRAAPGAMVKQFGAQLSDRWRTDFGIRFDYGIVKADAGALSARGVNTDSLADVLARQFEQEPYIERVYTPRTLAAAPQDDFLARRWRHSIPADFGWLVAAVPKRGTTWDTWTTGDNHGTPWQLDVQIPIVFWGGGLAPRTVGRTVRSVDIGPTLAHLLGIVPTEPVDGVVLPEVARRSP